MRTSIPAHEWTERNRRNIAAVRARGGQTDCCPECHAIVEVRYLSWFRPLIQARKGPEHTPECSAFLPEVPQ